MRQSGRVGGLCWDAAACLPWNADSDPVLLRFRQISKPTARDHLTKKVNRERCYFRRRKLQLVNQVADARDLSVTRRPFDEITVRVIHEGEISNEQENSERWISPAVAAG